MNIVKTNGLLPLAFILAVTVTGCASTPKADKTGTGNDPNVIVIYTNDDGCFAADRIGRGRHCQLTQPKTLCAEKTEWIRWTTTGKAIKKSIEFKPDAAKRDHDPLDRDNCKLAPDGQNFACPVKADIDEGTYKYSVELDGCGVHDPKIIITNKKRPGPA